VTFDNQPSENALLHELLQEIRELRIQVGSNRNEREPLMERNRASRNFHTDALDLTYGRTFSDIRNQPGASISFLNLKEARNMIPEIDGTSRNRVREFLNACNYAMKNIHPADEQTLLEAVICTKFKEKAMIDFHTRTIVSYEQLRRELETEYLGRRSTAHLQLEFNSLKQKSNESAQEFGRRVENLAMELYESMEEGQNHTPEQQRAILENIKTQALHNYQIGLHDSIKLLVRTHHYKTLREAITGASAEEKVSEPVMRKAAYQGQSKFDARARQPQNPVCRKCGKVGHYGQDCRTSRYANRFTLPRAEKSANINNIEKYCSYCKKRGHKREECWSLNGRPEKEQPRRTKRDNEKRRQVNTTIRKNTLLTKSEESFSSDSSSDGERKSKTKITRAAREHQITQVTDSGTATRLHFITLPVEETKKGRMSFLLDTGATLTLIKIGYLKGDTLIRERPLALTGVTGHKIYTLGKIKATITIGNREIRHIMHVVKDDFPINYEGILGIDFLTKQRAKCDHGKGRVRIGEVSFKLHPFKKITLTPRSETIVQAITNRNRNRKFPRS